MSPRYGRSLPVAIAALLLAGCTSGTSASARLGSGSASSTRAPDPPAPTDTRPSPAPSTPSPIPSAPAGPTTGSPAATSRAQAEAAARTAITRAVAQVPDHAAGVAAIDVTTGARVVSGRTGRMWTASMYKLLVLETLLRQNGPLSGSQLVQATKMIENSDNKAGYALWLDAGGNAGLESTMHALGMTHSKADGTDPTFTELTPADAVQLAVALVRPGPLSAASRRQALGLMRNVEADERWGVGVVADRGTDFANKNGWLSVDNKNPAGETDDGRWVVTSVGVVTVHGHQVLIAAMSEHEPSEAAGIATLQSLAKDAVTLLGT